jgi:cell division protein FtsQ
MSSNPMRQLWHSPDRLNQLAASLVWLSSFMLVSILAIWMANRPAFAVQRVMVDAVDRDLSHVSKAQVQAAVFENLEGTMLTADLRPMHQALEAIPWVREVSVRRIWPNRLLVRIEEQRAVATWAPDQLVNHRGDVFAASADDHDSQFCRLLTMRGPAGTQAFVLRRTREIYEWLSPLGREITSITLSDQYAWSLNLQGGLSLELGRDSLAASLEERVKMFVKTQPWLSERAGHVTKADLRYVTGYSFIAEPSPIVAIEPSSPPLCIGVSL